MGFVILLFLILVVLACMVFGTLKIILWTLVFTLCFEVFISFARWAFRKD